MTVSIWEGNKAQALIDAVANTQKIDKQQGVANAGKALIVGNDGIVGLGEVGLTDKAKAALLNLLRNVAYTDEHGRDYYNNLYEALYDGVTPIDPTLVYSLSGPRAFNGTSDVVNTGVSPFGVDSDWTLLYDIDENFVQAYTVDGTYTPVLLNSMLVANPWPGVQVVRRFDNNAHLHQINLWNISYRISIGGSDINNIKCAVTHVKGNEPNIVFIYLNGSQMQPTRSDGSFTFTPYEFNMCIGATSDSNGRHFWKGTVNKLQVYNKVLDSNEIKTLLEIGG